MMHDTFFLSDKIITSSKKVKAYSNSSVHHPCLFIMILYSKVKMLPYMQLEWCGRLFRFFLSFAKQSSALLLPFFYFLQRDILLWFNIPCSREHTTAFFLIIKQTIASEENTVCMCIAFIFSLQLCTAIYTLKQRQ